MLRRAPVSNGELARAAPFLFLLWIGAPDGELLRRIAVSVGIAVIPNSRVGRPPAKHIGLLPTGEGHMAQQSHGIYITRGFLHDSRSRGTRMTRRHASAVRPMFESLSQRTVIIGNSGAGKSALAESLADLILVPVIDLDLLNWEGDDYGRKRDEDDARRMTLEVSAQPFWIIEGVYGWLAEVALPRATALIWLDFPWSLCRAGLLARGPRRGATDQDTVELLKWAETYWNRPTSSSFAGHARMFNDFPSTKIRLENREQATLLLADLRASTIVSLRGVTPRSRD